MQLFEIISLHDIYLVIFSIALSLGLGAAVLSILVWFSILRDSKLSADEVSIVKDGRAVGWIAILLYSLSGIGLFTLSYEAMLALDIFRAAMVVFVCLVTAQSVVQFFILPLLTPGTSMVHGDPRVGAWFTFSEICIVTSWLFLVLHHSVYRLEVNFWLALTVYVTAIEVIAFLHFSLLRKHLSSATVRTFSISLGLTLGVAGVLLGLYMWLGIATPLVTADPTTSGADATEAGNQTFTMSEVAGHTHIEDCWVVISGDVYDVTPAAEKYPDLYQCGTDITNAYKEMRPEGISDRVQSYHIGSVGYTLTEVSEHKHKDSCWLIIDGMVFDVTPEAKLHPAAFKCGTNATENYHRNHGVDVSDKLMKLYIGRIDDGDTSVPDGNPEMEKKALAPYTELYVPAGSWDNRSLMAVVEKDVEKLVFIDGTTHEVLGRIHDVGFQPHTSVFSPDARYMYIVSRDGWLTKIDLNTLEPVKTVEVGENSRGTALTESGKYLAIGNYAPGNVVMLDAETLDILKTIPTVGEMDGKEVESRVGAVVQKDNDIIVALKDLNSVWVIDADEPTFAVVEKYWNIGDNKAPLHDAYLTPDGTHYLVAAMGANTVWVLNTETWKMVGEVKTGLTPHTGPGATWGTTTYVPAIGEGLITAIDTVTWEPKAYIKTGGPGLFIRSYHGDETYPYVWADPAFGDRHDEIYVIDARSNEIVETLKPVPGESSWHPEFTYDGRYVYVVSQTGNEITVYDAHDFSVVKRIQATTPSAVSNVGLRIAEPGL